MGAIIFLLHELGLSVVAGEYGWLGGSDAILVEGIDVRFLAVWSVGRISDHGDSSDG